MEKFALVIEWEWSPWTPWEIIQQYTQKKNPGPIPNTSGVYEVKRIDAVDIEERLIIGKSGNLARRVRDELVKSDDSWYAKRSRVLTDVQWKTSLLAVRWTAVKLHTELESLLHRQYKERFGTLPKFIDRT